MERPILKPIGTPVEELDTPTLVVDLAVLEKNIETVHGFFRNRKAKLRPYVGTHRCPALAHMQLAAGGTVGGVAVGTVGQAEAFADNGVADLMVTTEVVGPPKIERICALARRARVTVVVDSAGNVDDLARAAKAHGVTLRAAVDVHTRLNGAGVEPGKPAVDLAKRVAKAKGLEFVGFASYEGPILEKSPAKLAAESRRWIQQVLDTREMAEKAGLDVQSVVVGGTHNYEIAGAMKGVTEVPAGAYALLEERYRPYRKQLKPAASVLCTVTSTPEPGTAVADAGMKSCGNDTGLPGVRNVPGAVVRSLSAEHTNISMAEAKTRLTVGDKVWLTPWEVGVTANVYDYINAIRKGKLEAIFEVTARGRYR